MWVTMMSCWDFQLWQSPLIFVLWEGLLRWQPRTGMLRLVSGLDTQENGLYLKLLRPGYIRSAWVADGQQLGPSSQNLWTKWPMRLAADRLHGVGYFMIWGADKGILCTQHRFHYLMVLLAVFYRQFNLLSGLWDFWQWHLGSFCRTHCDHWRSAGFPSCLCFT